jgi:hypothetical protein
MLIGEYTHSIDDKNRISLPAKFRAEMGKKVVVTPGLDRSKYIVKKIELTEKGRFVFIPEKGAKRTLDLLGNDRRFVDCMFIALHGSVGEDGAVQGLLEVLGIAYNEKKVIIVSPTTFAAYLQSVLYGFKAFKIEEKTKEMKAKLKWYGE